MKKSIFSILLLSIFFIPSFFILAPKAKSDTVTESSTSSLAGTYSIQTPSGVTFFARIQTDGAVLKSYPKPESPLGKIKKIDDHFIFTPAANMDSPDVFSPLLNNVVDLSKFKADEFEFLKKLLFASKDLQIQIRPSGDLLLLSEKSAATSYAWDTLQVRKLAQSELDQIQAFEKSMLGSWSFVRLNTHIGAVEQSSDQPDTNSPCQKTMVLQADGKAVIDGESGFFVTCDGTTKNISIQTSNDPSQFSNDKEYNVLRVSTQELCIRTCGQAGFFTEYVFKKI